MEIPRPATAHNYSRLRKIIIVIYWRTNRPVGTRERASEPHIKSLPRERKICLSPSAPRGYVAGTSRLVPSTAQRARYRGETVYVARYRACSRTRSPFSLPFGYRPRSDRRRGLPRANFARRRGAPGGRRFRLPDNPDGTPRV